MSSRTDGYRLLAVTKHEGCSACKRFMENHYHTLRKMITAQNLVSFEHVPFVSTQQGNMPLPARQGGAARVHPQLISYVLGYPTFILVHDENYANHRADLKPLVFNRVIRDGSYTFGPLTYAPQNIVEWVADEMNAISYEPGPSSDTEETYESFLDLVCAQDMYCTAKHSISPPKEYIKTLAVGRRR